MKIKAVFFDAGGTIVHPKPSLEGVYHRVCEGFGVRVELDDLRVRLYRLWGEYQEGRGEETGFLHDSDERDRAFWFEYSRRIHGELAGLAGVDFDAWFDRLHNAFASSESWVLYPEVEEVLNGLRDAGVRLGVISNWGSSLHPICDDLGLSSCMDFVLASAVFGCRKPSAEIFDRALSLAGVRPEEAVHVGDTHLDDIVGASRVGIRPLYIDRNGGASPVAASTDTLRTLLDWVEAEG